MIFWSTHIFVGHDQPNGCSERARRIVLEDDARCAELQGDGGLFRAHSGSHHQDLSGVTGLPRRGNEPCAMILADIEIEEHNSDGCVVKDP